MKKFHLLIISLLMIVLSSCAQLQLSVKDPEIKLTGIKLISSSGLQQKVEIKLNMYNPNGFTLPVDSVRYELALEGFKMIGGTTTSIGSIPANKAKDFKVSAVIDLEGGLRMLNSLLKNRGKQINYKLGAEVRLDLPLTPNVSVSKSGAVPFR